MTLKLMLVFISLAMAVSAYATLRGPVSMPISNCISAPVYISDDGETLPSFLIDGADYVIDGTDNKLGDPTT